MLVEGGMLGKIVVIGRPMLQRTICKASLLLWTSLVASLVGQRFARFFGLVCSSGLLLSLVNFE